MTYQEYLQKVNELTAKKNELYDIASQKWSDGDKAGQEATYAEIDVIDAELNALVDPNDEPLTDDNDNLMLLGLNLDEVGTYEDVERKHSWMRKTY